MDLEERRDPVFWRSIASDPACRDAFCGLPIEETIEAVIANPAVVPLASENGGFLFSQTGGFGRVFELHTLYREAGWGREVHDAAIAAFERIFSGPADMVTTFSAIGQWRTSPPRSFGFKQASRDFDNEFGSFRFWYLAREDWLKSPARLRSMGAH